ncbi:hypothetical protein D3C76_1462050 [compost metagenome]
MYNKLINKKEVMNDFLKEVHQNKLNFIQPSNIVLWSLKVISELEQNTDFDNVDMVYSCSETVANHLVASSIKDQYNMPWIS